MLINELDGSIPECIWDFEQIEFLHIAYNGFIGRFPNNLQIKSKVLKDINLSGNKLTGTIPESLFYGSYKELDLSKNKLSGTLAERDGFTCDKLFLDVNRISGEIPYRLFKNVTELRVLAGNDFMCELDQSDLPSQDSIVNSYTCGSFNFDVAISTFGVIFFFVLLFLFISSFRKSSYDFMLSLCKFYTISIDSLGDYPNIKAFLNILENYTISNVIVAVVIFVCQVITFPSLKRDYSTQDPQYSWSFSAAYVSGLPFILVLFFIWVVSISIFSYMISSKHSDQLASFEIKTVPRGKSTGRAVVLIAATLILELFVSIMLNIGYIILVEKSSEIVVSIIQFAFTIINIMLNSFLIPASIRHFDLKLKRKISLMSLMILFNSLIGPLISMILTSPRCFLDVLEGIEPISSTYPYITCLRLALSDTTCILEETVYFKLEFAPDFIYNNTCRNEIFKYFIPLLLLSYTYSLFFVPILYAYLSSVKNVSSLRRWVFYLVPAVLWPEEKFTNPPFIFLFDIETTMFKEDISIGLILTLGIISPPLLILICLTNITDFVTTRIVLLRYLKLTKDKDSMRLMESRFEHVWRCPDNFIWYAVSFSCLFHISFLLDMANDGVDFIDTIWIIIVFPCVILLYRSTKTLYKNFVRTKPTIKEEAVYDDELKVKEINLTQINAIETLSPIQSQYLS